MAPHDKKASNYLSSPVLRSLSHEIIRKDCITGLFYSCSCLDCLNSYFFTVQSYIFGFYRIIKKNLGKAPLTYQKFTTVVDSIGLPPKPVDAPNALPKEAQPEDLAAAKYNVPTLAEFGLDVKSLHPTKFPGGETEGLARLAQKLSDKASYN